MEHSQDQILELLTNSKQAKKSSKQLSQLIKILFSEPERLGDKFFQKTRKPQSPISHNLDIQQISKVYSSIALLGKNADITQCLDKIFCRFQMEGELKAYLTGIDKLRFFFVVLLWQNIFTDQFNKLILLKFLNLIAHSGKYRQKFGQWLDNLNSQKIILRVIKLQKYLEDQFQKIQPGVIDPNLMKYVEINIKNMCLFLQLLYHSNTRKNRIPKETFINHRISKYYQPLDQFKLSIRKVAGLNFIQYPFLLPLDYKYRLLEIQSIFQQKINMQKSMEFGLANLISHMHQLAPHQNLSIQGLLFLKFQINRSNILDDSMEKLGKTTHNLKSPMKISFIGQEGADQGGVKNQYFQLLVKEIFNPYLDMFVPKNQGRVYWFNSYSFQAPIRFQFVGMLLGLAIYNLVLLDIKFPKVLYRKLLQKSTQDEGFTAHAIQDLADIQPDIANGLKKILQTQQPLDNLQLYFNIEFQNFGEKIIQELVQDGNSIRVTQDNKNQYCQLYADYMLNKHTAKQFIAFKRGFYRVVTGSMINLLQPQELENIICGNPQFDFKDLEESTQYQGGFTKDTPVIKYLWDILHDLTHQEKKAFLVFVTGHDRVPIQGLKALKMVIQRHNSNTEHLPTAHTCFNVLLLPQYENKKKLQTKIKLMLKNNQGFGLI